MRGGNATATLLNCVFVLDLTLAQGVGEVGGGRLESGRRSWTGCGGPRYGRAWQILSRVPVPLVRW